MKPTKRHQTKDKERVAAPVAHSSESEHGSEEDSDGDHTDYERERLENIRRNQEIMRQLSLPQAAADFAATSSTFTSSSPYGADRKKRSAPTPGVKREKRIKNSELLPRRKSNRLANIDPEDPVAKNRQDKYIRELETLDHARRERRTGDLSLSDVSGHGDEAKFAKLMEEMTTYVPDKARVKDIEDESDGEDDSGKKVKKEIKEEDDNDKDADKKVKKEEPDDNDTGIKKYFRPRRASAAAVKDKGKTSQPVPDIKSEDKHANKEPSLRKKVQALRIRGPWPTVKVCQGRVYCMAIHENKDKVLVCGGDIDGNLGFWDLDESQDDDYEPEYDEEPNIYSYKAHTRTLSSMQYSPTDPTKLFTTSYDGSVRYLDLVKQQFIESYVASPDVSDHLGSISLESSGHQLWFADNDGAVTLKDVRTPKDEMVYRKVLHEKKVGCVNVNPKFSNLIVTSSLDRTMKIWDVRTFGKYKDDEPIEELAEFPHGLSVTSAMWSPDGASIASTSYDDNVRIFNNFDPALPDVKEIPEPVRIRHNNRSGRWVTMLRAVWSHQFNWFSIGNMNKSVDIYSRGTGDLMANLKDARNLTTVPAVNAWHPNRVLIASGMANGKMVIWR